MGYSTPQRNVVVVEGGNDATARRLARAVSPAQVPLDLPTPDDNPSVTHPSVVLIPEGLGGYRYWLAYTPYPGAARENPCVVASNDGVHWEVPAGAALEVCPLSDAVQDGAQYQSDCHLEYVDGTLYLFWRAMYGTVNENLYVKTTTDGVNWSERTLILNNAEDFLFISPAVRCVNGQWVMWVVADVEGDNEVHVRTADAPDGDWSEPTVCAIPATLNPWHIDVVHAADRYHMLASTTGHRLRYLVSDDGETWEYGDDGLFPLSGLPWDTDHHYRSALLPMPGSPLAFELYIAGITLGSGTVWDSDAVHRIARYTSFPFRASSLIAPSPSQGGENRLLVPANFLTSAFNSPAFAVVDNRWPSFVLETGKNQSVIGNVHLPSDWGAVDVSVLWSNASGEGNVRLDGAVLRRDVGEDMTSGDQPSNQSKTNTVVAAAAGGDLLTKTKLIEAWTPGETDGFFHFRVNRVGTDATNDTLAANINVYGFVFEKVTV